MRHEVLEKDAEPACTGRPADRDAGRGGTPAATIIDEPGRWDAGRPPRRFLPRSSRSRSV
ncbi:hypothetical protein ACN26Y_05410 [Micromonospora sp. WMMD558]|uniref:hypothetical protein n=1 Tax=unclassified Micromonospora TaxID=2617518 RepID=UPI0012B49681|nr:hypothetical protein [Micromonospora sp. WMMC415]QGN45767.1 hypothetical protein GKC29_02110 [Micromonospora sp. WMMC415]